MSRMKIKNAEVKSLTYWTNQLNEFGFTTEFKVTPTGLLKSLKTGLLYSAPEVKLIHTYVFEGESFSIDKSVLYALETVEGEKGILLDTCGVYRDAYIINFIRQVENVEREMYKMEQEIAC